MFVSPKLLCSILTPSVTVLGGLEGGPTVWTSGFPIQSNVCTERRPVGAPVGTRLMGKDSPSEREEHGRSWLQGWELHVECSGNPRFPGGNAL